MRPTIKQVAERASVSISTVSHVLNGTHYVSPELTERVLRAVQDLGYEQNPVARILAGGRSHVIGILVPDLSSSYAGQIVRGVDEELSPRHYDLMLYTHRRGKKMASTYTTAFASGLVAGLLIIVPEDLGDFFDLLKAQQMPYVLVDPFSTRDPHPIVDSTNRAGAYQATEYLISLGHRRIGFVTGYDFLECARERLAGYRAALSDHGLPVDEALIVPGDFSRAVGYQAAQHLLDLPNPPTAIFASNDYMAFGVVDAVRNRGLRIPADFSVVGFDDIPQAAAARPALTTVRQPLSEMGAAAARLLLEIMADARHPSERIRLATELIIRESCDHPASFSSQHEGKLEQ